MRICLFSMTLPVHCMGGMEIHAWELAEGLKRYGHEVIIITGKHPDNIEFEEKEGIRIYYIGKGTASSNYPLSYWDLSTKKFIELNNTEKFDIIHSESGAAWGFIKKNFKARYSIPVVTTLQGTTLGEIKSVLNRPFTLKSILIIGFLIFSYITVALKFVKSSDAVIAVSRKVRDETGRCFFIDMNRIFVIGNGINTEVFKPGIDTSTIKKKYNITNEKIILTAGRLEQEKGVQFAIEAFSNTKKEFKNSKLMIIGTGKYLSTLKSLAEQLNIASDVIFVGDIPNKDMPAYYNLADVFITPTIRVEGLPLVIAEAMACGKPVIASNIGGIPDIVEDGTNGFLIPPGNVKALEEKILLVLKNQELATDLRNNARKMVLERFSIDKMIGETIKVYERVLHRER